MPLSGRKAAGSAGSKKAKKQRVNNVEDDPDPVPASAPARSSRSRGSLSEDALADNAGVSPQEAATLKKALNHSFWSQWDTQLLYAWLADWKKIKITKKQSTDREYLINTLCVSPWAARPKEGIELSELRKVWTTMVGAEAAGQYEFIPGRHKDSASSSSAAASSSSAAAGAPPQLPEMDDPFPQPLFASPPAAKPATKRASAAAFFSPTPSSMNDEEEEGNDEDDRAPSPVPKKSRPTSQLHECLHCMKFVESSKDQFICPHCLVRGDLEMSHGTNVHLSQMALRAPATPASKEPAAAAASSSASSGQSLSTAGIQVSAPKLLDKELQTMLDEHPTNTLFRAVCPDDLAIVENRKALGASATQRPTTKALQVVREGKLINIAYALPIAIGSAAALEGRMGFDSSGNVTVVASKALAKVTTLEQFATAFFSTIGPALVNRPMALAQWFSLGRTALKIQSDNRGDFAPAAAYMEQLLAERVFASEDFSRVSDQILTTIRGAAMARPPQPGAGGPDRNRAPDRRGGGGSAHQDRGPCFSWNRGAVCATSPCKFAHVCTECRGAHKAPVCPSPRERSTIPSRPGSKAPGSIKTAKEAKAEAGYVSP